MKSIIRDKVSLVIPLFNVENYIEKTLFSAFNQSYNNIEYIIIDDHGYDNSLSIAKSTINKFGKNLDIKIIDHGKNIGIGGTRNTGINIAKGKYIIFLDGDDRIEFNAIEKLIESASKYNTDVTIGSYKSIDIENNGKMWKWVFNNNIFTNNNSIINAFFHGNFYIMSWNKLYNLEFLRKNCIECIPDTNNEDVYFSFLVALKAEKISTISDITYYYTIRNGSVMSLFNENNFLDYNKIIKQLIELAKKNKDTKNYHYILKYISRIKNSIIIKLYHNKLVNSEFKKQYLHLISKQNVSINDIIKTDRLSILDKVKISIQFFPLVIQIFVIILATQSIKMRRQFQTINNLLTKLV